jgi:hypothetical protein
LIPAYLPRYTKGENRFVAAHHTQVEADATALPGNAGAAIAPCNRQAKVGGRQPPGNNNNNNSNRCFR